MDRPKTVIVEFRVEQEMSFDYAEPNAEAAFTAPIVVPYNEALARWKL